MQRILAMLVSSGALFLLRRIFLPSEGPQPGQAAAPQHKIIRFLSERLSGGHVADDAVGLICAVALLLAGVMGYVLHIALRDRAFGPWFNGVLCFFGAAGADATFIAIAPKAADPSALVMLSSVGAICLVLLFALAKAALLERLDNFGSGAAPIRFAARAKSVPTSRITAVTRRL